MPLFKKKDMDNSVSPMPLPEMAPMAEFDKTPPTPPGEEAPPGDLPPPPSADCVEKGKK